MSEITVEVAREVLALAITHCPCEVEDALRFHREAREASLEMSRAQSAGPDGAPASVGLAETVAESALDSLALDVAEYAGLRARGLVVAP